MEMVIKKLGGVVVVGLAERSVLDETNAEDFQKKMTDMVEHGTRYVVDMSNITFLDSIGLHAFVKIGRYVSSLDGQMKLCRMDPLFRNVFKLMGIHHVLQVYDKEEEALASYEHNAEAKGFGYLLPGAN